MKNTSFLFFVRYSYKTMLPGYDLKMLSFSKNKEGAVERMNPAQPAKFNA